VAQVLVVDDERGARVLIGTFLDRGGFQVVHAKNSQEAMELLEKGPLPDLILMDVNMPEMDGITLCRAVRERYPNALFPVLILSASGDPDTKKRGLEAGATEYLQKPILHHDLVTKIKTLLKLDQNSMPT
jgi:CheY-like chemotaxis protein